MNKNNKIPLYELVFFIILIILIIVRMLQTKEMSKYISIVNYISLLVGFFSNWIILFNVTEKNKEKNFCKGIFGILILISAGIGIYFFVLSINISSKANDLITLLALLFCVCSTICQKTLRKLFKLKYK